MVRNDNVTFNEAYSTIQILQFFNLPHSLIIQSAPGKLFYHFPDEFILIVLYKSFIQCPE